LVDVRGEDDFRAKNALLSVDNLSTPCWTRCEKRRDDFFNGAKLDFVVAAKLILLVDVRGEEVDVSPRLVDVCGEDAFSCSTTSGRLGTEFKRSGWLATNKKS
jgi:hypothetical protein